MVNRQLACILEPLRLARERFGKRGLCGVATRHARLISIIGYTGLILATALSPPAHGSTLVGLEYAIVDNDRLTAGVAKTFGALGITSMKL